MAAKNKTCLACGTKFSYCPDCSQTDALKPAWASEFCSEDCATIWTTAVKFNLGKLTKPEAKFILSGIALKPMDQYAPCIQRDFNKILAEEPKPKRNKKFEIPVEIPVVEEVVADITTNAAEDINLNKNIHEVVETIENE